MILLAMAMALGMRAQVQIAEPTYTTEPVTQRIPHCQAGFKLQQYSCGNMGGCGEEFTWHAVIPEQMGGWFDVPEGTGRGMELGPHEGDYRCYEIEKKAQGDFDPSTSGPVTRLTGESNRAVNCEDYWPKRMVWAGGIVWDRNGCAHPIISGSCTDPEARGIEGCTETAPWPTSATISLYKQDGTCIAGACAVHFPDNPTDGQCWMDKDTRYCFTHGSWQFKPQDTGRLSCGPTEHLHPTTMSTFQPDIKGGPLPQADGKCHKDSDDSAVYPRKKLEAKR